MKSINAISLLFFLVSSFSMLSAQNTPAEVGPEVKSFSKSDASSFELFATDGEYLYAYRTARYNHLAYSHYATIIIYKMDLTGAIVQQAELKSLGKKNVVENAFLCGDTIDLLIAEYWGKESIPSKHIRINKQNLTTISEENIPTMFRPVHSPEGSWFGCITLTEDKNSLLTVYDACHLDVVWKKEINTTGMIGLYLTEEAEVIFAGIDENDQLHFRIITEENDKDYVTDADLSDVRSMVIANYQNGRIYAGGILFEWTKHKNPKNRMKQISGYYSLMFDTKTNKTNMDRKNFTRRSWDMIVNFNSDNEPGEDVVLENILYVGNIGTAKNTVLAYQYIPSVVTDYNYFQYGMIVFGISPDGEIAWSRFPRRKNNFTGAPTYLTQDLFEHNGKACVVYETYDETALCEDENKAVDDLNMNKLNMAGLVMLSIDADGNVKRELLAKSRKYLISKSVKDEKTGKRMFYIHNPLQKANVVTLK